MRDTGTLYIIAAPSGTGKTTLVKALTETLSHMTVSISHTTRSKRSHEIEGVHYYFVNHTEFNRMIAQGDFLEYASIFDHLYGTSKHWVEQTLANGTDVVLEIDWQGQQQIKRLFPASISIFILPPSLQDLHDRLIKRNQDHPDIIKKRLQDAQDTVSHISLFDYVVINDRFEQALHDLKSIIEAARLVKKHQIKKHAQLIKELTNNLVH